MTSTRLTILILVAVVSTSALLQSSGGLYNTGIVSGPENLTNPYGFFWSAGYPFNYPDSNNQTWVIRALPNKQIHLRFRSFNTQEGGDVVEIRDGGSESSELLGQESGVLLPPSYVSSSNNMHIKFTSDEIINSVGFYAIYQTADHVDKNKTGEFLSKNYPDTPPRHTVEEWVIESELKRKMVICFKDFKLVASDTIPYRENLTIYGGTTMESPQIFFLKGTPTTMPALIVEGNQVLFRLQSAAAYSDPSRGFRGFYASANALVSDNYETGYIQTPNYPENYTNMEDFIWLIYPNEKEPVNSTRKIYLYFNDFITNIEDFAAVYDGPSSDSPLLGNISGFLTKPKSFWSTDSVMTVQFVSDDQNTSCGFKAFYQSTDHVIKGDIGTFSSSGYPRPYRPNSEERWIIETTRKTFIYFDTFNTTATSDVLFVYDGPTRQHNETVQRYSGTSRSTTLVPGAVYLQFVATSTNSANLIGFYARFASVDEVTNSTHNGIVKSPNYPENYDENEDFLHLIYQQTSADMGHKIYLFFTVFDLQDDNVTVYDGMSTSSVILGTYTGNSLPNSLVSSGNSLSIHLKSNAQNSGLGYVAEFAYVEYAFTNSSGYLLTPGFPSHYPTDSKREWVIDVPDRNKKVGLNFLDFNLGVPGTDYVEIRDGAGPASPILAIYNGTQIPPSVSSTSHKMYVKFQSVKGSFMGFYALFSEVE
jgi:hypothetical protein